MILRDNPILLRALIVAVAIAVFFTVFSLFITATRGMLSKAEDAKQFFMVP